MCFVLRRYERSWVNAKDTQFILLKTGSKESKAIWEDNRTVQKRGREGVELIHLTRRSFVARFCVVVDESSSSVLPGNIWTT